MCATVASGFLALAVMASYSIVRSVGQFLEMLYLKWTDGVLILHGASQKHPYRFLAGSILFVVALFLNVRFEVLFEKRRATRSTFWAQAGQQQRQFASG